MKRMILLTLSMMLATPLLANPATEAVHSRAVVWDGVPISISLPVGKEMLLSFDGDVRVGVPSALYQSANIDSLRGTIYITANKSFESQRLQVERLRDGLRMLIDVRAQEGITTANQVDIVTTNEEAAANEKQATQDALTQHVNRVTMPIPTLLVRYAYQNIYSPSHAIEPLPGVSRATMQIAPDIQAQAFPLWPVNAKPVAAWSLGGYTVTAVTLTHRNNDTLTLDPRQVTAALYGTTFAFPDLGPAGTDSAISTAFLVSKGTLADSLPPAPIPKGATHDQ
ncbi:TIGR03749 family integrating conjugative element protein [Shewanella sp. DC2-4]|uniref:TIGR03749 family integrating conjugative element protein n=1 Tax=Shewanella sp. DC2-4 TaxID=2739431 RepID=UPI001565E17C|nr:TIGR03749 family integrating conjugative element protein [Shewanella sp. DC2-4]NRD34622.1 TIGR03749 family integrating conjugative element protein [Shewanella sp. DC2-4]